ncbi:MAG: fumarylacetoacetate hydrolase family protein [Sinimarinibacterium flocculans]|uniref:fumarylacetoacetate hydrolase family protein n=1 Tax=Sinimarinibacterium flocculans TaxID=985250 RepID=UPI003C418B01
MNIASFLIDGRRELGLVNEGAVTSITQRLSDAPADMVSLMRTWDRFEGALRALPTARDYALSDVKLLPPVERPGKILGIGLNYADHIEEAGLSRPQFQTWFTKAVTSVNGPFDPIHKPRVSEMLDYEAELVFVIGRRCKHVPAEKALDVVFGFCIGNDVSVRDWQLRSGQFAIGKSFDTHAPFGPWLVTPDALDAGNLELRCFVNDVERQRSNTRHMVFCCAEQIAHLSQAMTLEPGDVIFTGTPGGVGGAMKPPVWLEEGDSVRVEIDGIGTIENKVVLEPETLEGAAR